MINHINTNYAHHIITIEDPIEYLHEHKASLINQREVGRTRRAFLNALRASLREDPDVLLVGEMRDVETISAGDHRCGNGPPRLCHPAHEQRG
jgi:twitching motility protein PilT